jgi:O-antigen ligase
MSAILSPAARSAYLVLTLAILLAADAVRYSLGWWVYGALALASGAASILLLIAQRREWSISALPYPLVAFVAIATLSLVWSDYRPSTALGLLTTWLIVIAGIAIAVTFSWREILAGLAGVLKAVLVLSLLFELVVSLVVRAPVLPWVPQPGVDYAQYEEIPKLLYWSRNELFQVFDDGRIQGIVGNANHLGFLALLSVIVFSIQLAEGTIRRRWGIIWLAAAVATLLFTRSATVTVALVVVLVVTGAVLLVRRARTPRARGITYGGLVVAVLAGATVIAVFRTGLLELLGKSADLTGRIGIWQNVIDLAQQRPVAGWGWVSFWVPWAAPFDTLAFRNGVRMLQAHSAWIDVWFQVGIIGLVVFAALVVSTLVRSWLIAVDRAQVAPRVEPPYTAMSLMPLLILTALLVQSVAESRLIVEYGWALLVIIAVKSKSSAEVRITP